MTLARAFALNFESPIALPMAPGHEPVDVSVRLLRSDRPVTDDDVAVREGDALLFDMDGTRFRVSGGSSIDIDAPRKADDDWVRAWLTGTVMAALLAQHERLVLHANALMMPQGGAALVMGESGAGKSWLAARWLAEGGLVLGDDLAAIAFDGGALEILSGLQRIKLWEADAAMLADREVTRRRVIGGLDKYEIEWSEPTPLPDRVPLDRLYLLEQADEGEDASIDRIDGPAAVAAVIDQAFRWEVGQLWHDENWQFDRCLQLARETPIYRFRRPWGRERREEGFALLRCHLT